MLARPCGSEKVRMLGARLRTTGRWYWPPPSRAQMQGGACRVQPLHRLRKRLVVARSWLGKCAEVVGTSHQRLESRSVYALRATFIDESATTENGRKAPCGCDFCAGPATDVDRRPYTQDANTIDHLSGRSRPCRCPQGQHRHNPPAHPEPASNLAAASPSRASLSATLASS